MFIYIINYNYRSLLIYFISKFSNPNYLQIILGFNCDQAFLECKNRQKCNEHNPRSSALEFIAGFTIDWGICHQQHIYQHHEFENSNGNHLLNAKRKQVETICVHNNIWVWDPQSPMLPSH